MKPNIIMTFMKIHNFSRIRNFINLLDIIKVSYTNYICKWIATYYQNKIPSMNSKNIYQIKDNTEVPDIMKVLSESWGKKLMMSIEVLRSSTP